MVNASTNGNHKDPERSRKILIFFILSVLVVGGYLLGSKQGENKVGMAQRAATLAAVTPADNSGGLGTGTVTKPSNLPSQSLLSLSPSSNVKTSDPCEAPGVTCDFSYGTPQPVGGCVSPQTIDMIAACNKQKEIAAKQVTVGVGISAPEITKLQYSSNQCGVTTSVGGGKCKIDAAETCPTAVASPARACFYEQCDGGSCLDSGPTKVEENSKTGVKTPEEIAKELRSSTDREITDDITLGQNERLFRTEAGDLRREIKNPDGTLTTRTYNDSGLAEQRTYGTSGDLTEVVKYRSDAGGNRIESRTYDGSGSLISADRISADGSFVRTDYNPGGDVATVQRYDANANLVTESKVDPVSGLLVETTYSPPERIQTAALSGATRSSYILPGTEKATAMRVYSKSGTLLGTASLGSNEKWTVTSASGQIVGNFDDLGSAKLAFTSSVPTPRTVNPTSIGSAPSATRITPGSAVSLAPGSVTSATAGSGGLYTPTVTGAGVSPGSTLATNYTGPTSPYQSFQTPSNLQQRPQSFIQRFTGRNPINAVSEFITGQAVSRNSPQEDWTGQAALRTTPEGQQGGQPQVIYVTPNFSTPASIGRKYMTIQDIASTIAAQTQKQTPNLARVDNFAQTLNAVGGPNAINTENKSYGRIQDLIIEDEAIRALRVAEEEGTRAKNSVFCRVIETAENCQVRREERQKEVERATFVKELEDRVLPQSAIEHFLAVYDGWIQPRPAPPTRATSTLAVLNSQNQDPLGDYEIITGGTNFVLWVIESVADATANAVSTLVGLITGVPNNPNVPPPSSS